MSYTQNCQYKRPNILAIIVVVVKIIKFAYITKSKVKEATFFFN